MKEQLNCCAERLIENGSKQHSIHNNNEKLCSGVVDEFAHSERESCELQSFTCHR